MKSQILKPADKLQSMTGYGKVSGEFDNKNYLIEIRTLNSKQLDVFLKTPSTCKPVESEIRSLIAQELIRGRVDVLIEISSDAPESYYTINEALYKKFAMELRALVDIKISEKELMPVIMSLPEVLKSDKEEMSPEELKIIVSLAQQAVEQIQNFRILEGKALKKDIAKQLLFIQKKIKEIEPLEGRRIAQIKQKLLQQFQKNMQDLPHDKNRLEQELIYYMEKLDITEEQVRLSQHCDFFRKTLNTGYAQGKKLSFIAQEMGREINTLGAKAQDFTMQKIVVEMKDALEKIKEQLGNVL